MNKTAEWGVNIARQRDHSPARTTDSRVLSGLTSQVTSSCIQLRCFVWSWPHYGCRLASLFKILGNWRKESTHAFSWIKMKGHFKLKLYSLVPHSFVETYSSRNLLLLYCNFNISEKRKLNNFHSRPQFHKRYVWWRCNSCNAIGQR